MSTRADRLELGLIALAVGALGVFAGVLPDLVELGSLLAMAALALLGQGLLRDLWLLSKQRKAGASLHGEEVSCLCMESTVGLSGVLAGIIFTVAGVQSVVAMADWIWPMAGALVWLGGYAMKDVVIQWSPWKLRRVKDHGSLIVRWRTASRK